LRSGGGAGRRRLERVVVLTTFPGLELRLLQVWWRYSSIYSANKNRFLNVCLSMHEIAWLYNGMERSISRRFATSRNIVFNSWPQRAAFSTCRCVRFLLYQGAC
jgi:hypothetical protein